MKKIILLFAILFGFSVMAWADSEPTFVGGNDAMTAYIKENMKYPQTAKDNGIEGIVHLLVTVKADGSIGSVKVQRMIDPDLEQEAIRLVKGMPAWNPAIVNDKPADGTAKVDIPFYLTEDEAL